VSQEQLAVQGLAKNGQMAPIGVRELQFPVGGVAAGESIAGLRWLRVQPSTVLRKAGTLLPHRGRSDVSPPSSGRSDGIAAPAQAGKAPTGSRAEEPP